MRVSTTVHLEHLHKEILFIKTRFFIQKIGICQSSNSSRVYFFPLKFCTYAVLTNANKRLCKKKNFFFCSVVIEKKMENLFSGRFTFFGSFLHFSFYIFLLFLLFYFTFFTFFFTFIRFSFFGSFYIFLYNYIINQDSFLPIVSLALLSRMYVQNNREIL